jgi:hypothetical protein
MRLLLAVVLCLAIPAAAQQAGVEPRAVVRAAERAVSDDSADAVRARWQAALQRDATDRTAALGLATLGVAPIGEGPFDECTPPSGGVQHERLPLGSGVSPVRVSTR